MRSTFPVSGHLVDDRLVRNLSLGQSRLSDVTGLVLLSQPDTVPLPDWPSMPIVS